MTTKLGLNRREGLVGLLALVATASCSKLTRDVKSSRDDALTYRDGLNFLGAEEMAFLTVLAGTILPATDTPGAVEVGVPSTLQDLLSSWGEDNIRAHWRGGLAQLKTALDSGGNFTTLPPERQTEVLSIYDAKAFKSETQEQFYKDLKRTVTMAYYMSESGASAELNYDPVPGGFRGCVPYSEIGKSWAS